MHFQQKHKYEFVYFPDFCGNVLRSVKQCVIADALASLEEAVKAQDKPTTKKLLGKFAGGTTKAVLAGVASKALLSWMGIA